MSDSFSLSTSPVCAVVVIYFPTDDVVHNVREMVAQCGRVIAVDNGSSQSLKHQLAATSGVSLVVLEKNLGVGSALNRGAEEALSLGCTWFVTFDQDSYPEPGMVAALWAAHLRHPRAALLAPCISEEALGSTPSRWVRRNPRWPFLFQRDACENEDLTGVTMVVTSGSLTELETWRELGGFDENLFIDYVDIDFCHKIVQAGREINVVAEATLRHHLGERRSVKILGRDFRPMFHPPFRHYYMSRNRIILWRRYAWSIPHWAAFDFLFASYNLFRVITLEDRKLAKLGMMLRGTWHGLRRITGPLQSTPES